MVNISWKNIFNFQTPSQPLCTVCESAFFARKKSSAPHSSRDSESRIKAHRIQPPNPKCCFPGLQILCTILNPSSDVWIFADLAALAILLSVCRTPLLGRNVAKSHAVWNALTRIKRKATFWGWAAACSTNTVEKFGPKSVK